MRGTGRRSSSTSPHRTSPGRCPWATCGRRSSGTRWLDRDAYAQAPVPELLRLYVRFDQEAERTPSLRDEARGWALRLEQGDPEARRMWQEIVEHSLAEFRRIYERLGVAFDSWRGESAYLEESKMVIEEATRKGAAQEDQGALIVPLPT